MEWTTLEEVEWWIEQITNSQPGVEFRGPAFLRPFHFAVSETTAENIASEILAVFRGAGTSDKTTLNAIDIALSEIFSNCFFHAEVGREICGLACAQSWPHARLAQVVVADIGIGIRASLGANPTYTCRLKTENAAALATELGVTSKPAPGGAHSGYGLTVARQLMEKHGGNFLLLSGNECFRATEHNSRAQELRVPWRGTIVALEWRMDRPFDIGAVYGGWPKDGDGDEFF